MATAITNNTYSAIVPAVYGTATPVIDVGHGAGSITAAAAFSNAGSVVVNLGNAPAGAVTYTPGGLSHEMTSSVVGAQAVEQAPAPVKHAEASARVSGADDNGGDDGLYDDSGAYQPHVIAVQTVELVHLVPMGGADETAMAVPAGSLVSAHA